MACYPCCPAEADPQRLLRCWPRRSEFPPQYQHYKCALLAQPAKLHVPTAGSIPAAFDSQPLLAMRGHLHGSLQLLLSHQAQLQGTGSVHLRLQLLILLTLLLLDRVRCHQLGSLPQLLAMCLRLQCLILSGLQAGIQRTLGGLPCGRGSIATKGMGLHTPLLLGCMTANNTTAPWYVCAFRSLPWQGQCGTLATIVHRCDACCDGA